MGQLLRAAGVLSGGHHQGLLTHKRMLKPGPRHGTWYQEEAMRGG